MEKYKSAFNRFLRALVSVLIAGIAVEYGDNSLYLLLSPIILAIDKFVRDTLSN